MFPSIDRTSGRGSHIRASSVGPFGISTRVYGSVGEALRASRLFIGALLLTFVASAWLMDVESVWVWAPLAALFVCVTFIGWLQALARHNVVANTPCSRVGSAAQGYVELAGTACLPTGQRLISPLGQVPCVWYYCEIQCRDRRGNWRTEERLFSEQPFLLRDDTGDCLIDPTTGFDIACSRIQRWPEGGGLNTEVRLSFEGAFGSGGEQRYIERVFLPGDRLCAVGEFGTEGGVQAPDARGNIVDVSTVLRGWKKDTVGLLKRFDTDGDGRIDSKEWDRAVEQARLQVMQNRAVLPVIPVQNVLRVCTDGRPSFISDLDEKSLLHRTRRDVWLMLLLFLACTVFAGALLEFTLQKVR